jgi:hypothetical protein
MLNGKIGLSHIATSSEEDERGSEKDYFEMPEISL